MPEFELSYLLLSQSFVIYFNVFVVIALWLIYRSHKKRYLALAITAGLVEASRQFPDFLINLYPDFAPLYQLSLLLQFTASLLVLTALLQLTQLAAGMRRMTLAIPVLVFVVAAVTLQIRGLPEAGLERYIYVAPLILVTFILLFVATCTGPRWTPSRFLLTGTSFTLLVLRIWMTGLDFGEIFYLILYLEYLAFPMMLAAIILAEAEQAHQREKTLLEQQTQAGEDLQFIVDNADETILIADEVGLVRTWSAKAEKKFGYSFQQAVNKLHMDELFAQITLGKTTAGTAAFRTKMEAMDGKWFMIDVTVKTVDHRGTAYNIFILKDAVAEA